MNNEIPPLTEAFRINMRIIADELEEARIAVRFQKGDDGGRLIGIRMYTGQSTLSREYVYLASARELPAIPPADDAAFLVPGILPETYRNTNCSIIETDHENDLYFLFDLVQNIFEKFQIWEEHLQYALNHDLGIMELCRISVDFFKNPIFVHDAQFYVIACPVQVAGMLEWELDEYTGLKMVPLDLINDFKIDPEYISTLETVGAQMFSANLRGYRILYMNIWGPKGRYEGRLCMDELLFPLRPGHFLAIEHLVRIIQIAMNRHNLGRESFSRPFELVITNILDQAPTDSQILANQLQPLGWKLDDQYVCIKIIDNKRSMDNMAIISTCNYIEANISRSYSFKYHDNIVVIINLTCNGGSCDDCLAQLAYIIREGLFKAGVSSVYRNFAMTCYYYRQAELAIKYGQKNNNTLWYHHFDNYVLPYMLDCCCQNFSADMLCPEGLKALKQHDLKNETEYYKTLMVYLKNERRTIQTAKELFIHRSTLFYRLERIGQILKVNLDDPDVRLYLSICICLLNYGNK
jgi:hypothetical protein